MNVDSIMVRDVVTVGMDDTLGKVRDTFHSHGFHHLLVVDAGRVVGVVSDRDLLKNLSPFVGTKNERTQDHWLLDRKVHQIMSRKLVSVRTDTPIKVAMSLLIHHRVSCLPVVDEHERCAGIVTWRDFLRYSIDCGIEPGCTIKRPEAA